MCQHVTMESTAIRRPEIAKPVTQLVQNALEPQILSVSYVTLITSTILQQVSAQHGALQDFMATRPRSCASLVLGVRHVKDQQLLAHLASLSHI